MPRRSVHVVILFASWLAAWPPVEAAPEEVPLPVAKTAVLKDTDLVYVVDGAVRIPPGIEITLQKGVRIQGKNGASLEVAGSFVAHGVTGTEVHVRGVRIVLPEKVQQLHLDMCQLTDGTCVVTEKDEPTRGILTIENCEIEGESGIRIEATAGKIKLMSLKGEAPVRLVGVDVDGKQNRVEGSLRTSLFTGLEIENLADVTVRSCELRASGSFLNVRKLDFDANRLVGCEIRFAHDDAKAFGKTKISKCDLSSSRLSFHAPIGKKKKVTVVVEKCWFGGETDLAKIAELIHDQADDAENAVKVLVKKPAKREMRLAADWSTR